MDNNIVDEIKRKLGNKIIDLFEKNPQRYYISIDPKNVVECSNILFNDCKCRFVIATGIDTRPGLEILYHFSHDATGKMFTLKVLLTDKTNPEIDSIATIIKGAEWIEREMWELLGIKFKNHPNLKRLLLAPDWPEGNYPLRQAEVDTSVVSHKSLDI